MYISAKKQKGRFWPPVTSNDLWGQSSIARYIPRYLIRSINWVSVPKIAYIGNFLNFELIDLFLTFMTPPSLTPYRILKNCPIETNWNAKYSSKPLFSKYISFIDGLIGINWQKHKSIEKCTFQWKKKKVDFDLQWPQMTPEVKVL